LTWRVSLKQKGASKTGRRQHWSWHSTRIDWFDLLKQGLHVTSISMFFSFVTFLGST
jgi:hypothetical protein